MQRPAARDDAAAPLDAQPTVCLRIAFVVGIFPLVSETFIIDQIARLLDRGLTVDVYSMNRGDEAHVSRTYFDYDMAARTRYLDYPLSWTARFVRVWPRIWRLARRHPRTLLRALDVVRHRRWALSLKLLYWAEPLAGSRYDVVHCHFGTVARDFVRAHQVAGLEAPFVTTFYGIDVSKVFREERQDYYDDLKRACQCYLVMSDDMKRRVVEHGFPEKQVQVLPVSVDVDRYPFRARSMGPGEVLRLVAVGRFVEKKGFDDLLRALAIAARHAPRPVACTLVGGGPLEPELRALATSLGLQDTVRFPGYLPVEDVVDLFGESHLLVAPSKTAADGDME